MNLTENPFRGAGIGHPDLDGIPWPEADAARPSPLSPAARALA